MISDFLDQTSLHVHRVARAIHLACDLLIERGDDADLRDKVVAVLMLASEGADAASESLDGPLAERQPFANPPPVKPDGRAGRRRNSARGNKARH